MEHLVVLSDYDVFAYVMVGIATLAAIDLIYGTRFFFRGEWGVAAISGLAIAAYVLGHVLAWASTQLVETVVLRAMKPPVEHLLSATPYKPPVDLCGFVSSALLGSYFEPLNQNTQAKINSKQTFSNKEELYWHAYNTAKMDEHAFDRMITFHKLYSFSRNMSFAALLAAIAAIVQPIRAQFGFVVPHTSSVYGLPRWMKNPYWQSIVFLVLSVILFSRFLYFFRAHSIEVLTSYAYIGG